ncbi:hypothetical protein SATMO3_26860 [Sporomusa aerivorans]
MITTLLGLVSSDFAMLIAADDYIKRLANVNILFY